MTQRNGKIPDILLEQYLLGELDKSKAAEIRSLSESNPEISARLAFLKASNEEILERYPVRPMAAAIRQKAEQSVVKKRSFNFSTLAAPAAAMLVLIVISALWAGGIFNPPGDGKTNMNSVKTDGEIIYTKGLEAQLKIYRKSGSVNEMLKSGDAVAVGDTLQVAYIAAQANFGLIFSIDGRGAVTRHFPSDGGAQAAKLAHNGEQLLDYSYRLDDAPAFERFFFVTSAQSFEIAPIMAAAQAMAGDPQAARNNLLLLPGGLEQHDLLLVK